MGSDERICLILDDTTMMWHPLHLHRCTFEAVTGPGTGPRTFVPPGPGPTAHARWLLGGEAMPNWGTAIGVPEGSRTEEAAMGDNQRKTRRSTSVQEAFVAARIAYVVGRVKRAAWRAAEA